VEREHREAGEQAAAAVDPGHAEIEATRLLTGWPRQQQQANAMAIANLDGFS